MKFDNLLSRWRWQPPLPRDCIWGPDRRRAIVDPLWNLITLCHNQCRIFQETCQRWNICHHNTRMDIWIIMPTIRGARSPAIWTPGPTGVWARISITHTICGIWSQGYQMPTEHTQGQLCITVHLNIFIRLKGGTRRWPPPTLIWQMVGVSYSTMDTVFIRWTECYPLLIRFIPLWGTRIKWT